MRLLWPLGCEPPEYLSETDRTWLMSGRNFVPEDIRRTEQPWNSDYFLMAQILGHLSPSTGQPRYFHFAGELRRVYMARSADLSPTAEQLRLAMGMRSDSENGKCNPRSAMEFAINLLGGFAKSNHVKLAAKPLPATKQNEFCERLLSAWDFLSAVETSDNPVDGVAADLGIGLSLATPLQAAASKLSEMRSGNGSYRHRFVELNPANSQIAKRSIIPIRPTSPYDFELVRRLAPRIYCLSSREKTRDLLIGGINAYVEFAWSSEGCPVFLDPGLHGTQAMAFRNLLLEVDLFQKDIRFGSYDCKGSDSRGKWRKTLELSPRFSFEPWDVPGGKDNETQPWLGIKPTFNFGSPIGGSPGLFGFRFLMVMSYIVLLGSSE